jgi:phage protein D
MTTQNIQVSATNYPQGFLTQPRAIVMIDGYQVGITDIEINTAQFGYADTFSVHMPLVGQNPPIDRDYFAENQNVSVEIYIGFPSDPNSFSSGDLDLILSGLADRYEDNLCTNLISISGRDLTSKFIDTKITQKFPNQLSSDIVTMFANQQNLTPQVTPTTTPVGTFYYNQQTFLANQMSQWDLIMFLAQQEGFSAFVQGDTFIFEPKNSTSDSPYSITYQPASSTNPSPASNTTTLNVITNSSVAGNVQVTVRVPASTRNGQSFSAKSSIKQKSGKSLSTKKYVYRKPGLTPQQAQQLASQLLEQHTSQGIAIEFDLPGDNLLQKNSIIELQGTDTVYDQTYFPDEIVRRISLEEGTYHMHVYARNTSTNQEDTQ